MKTTRRDFVRMAAVAAAGVVVSACGATPTATPMPPTVVPPTQTPVIVKQTVVVEQTKIVERVVQVTPQVTPMASQLSGTMVVGRGGDSVWLDVGPETDGESERVMNCINDGLIDQAGTSAKIIPWLATSWDTTDSKTWVFHLRQGVKFHNGEDFNADVVKWNMDRWRDPTNKWRFGRTFEFYNTEFGADFAIDDVKVLGPYDVQVTLHQPTALMLVKLGQPAFNMLSPKAVQEQGDKYGTPAGKAIGTGPFKFVEWVSKDHITLERNESWWGGPPRLAKLIFRCIPDNSARWAELQAGSVQEADLAQSDTLQAMKNPNVTVYKLPALATGYIAFQQCTPPFDKLEVRQAIAAAVNWGAIVKAFYGEFGQLAGSFQPPAIMGSNPNVKPYEYNPDKAKQLLAKAGLADGFTTDFWYIPVVRNYFPDSKAIGEAIAVDLAKVGIKVNLKTEDWGAYLADRLEGKFPMWMLGWGSGNGDPDNFLGWHFKPDAVGKPKKEDCYNNPKVAQLLIDGALELDVTKREKIYQDAEVLIHDDVARIPVVWVASTRTFRNNVKGYVPVIFRYWYENLWIG